MHYYMHLYVHKSSNLNARRRFWRRHSFSKRIQKELKHRKACITGTDASANLKTVATVRSLWCKFLVRLVSLDVQKQLRHCVSTLSILFPVRVWGPEYPASYQQQVWLCASVIILLGRQAGRVGWIAGLANLMNSRFSERSSHWTIKNSWRRNLMSTSALHTYACTLIHVPAYVQLFWSCWCLMCVTTLLWVHEWHSNAVSRRWCFPTLFNILLWVTLNISITTLGKFLFEQNLLLSDG